jgi:hypothetical protein
LSIKPCARSVLTALVMFAVAIPVCAQTLGDIASKESERRQAGGNGKSAPAKVYTNDDLKAVPPPSSVPPPVTTAPAEKDAKAEDAKKPPQEEKGEEYWRQRMGQAREELRRNQMFRDALQTRLNSLSNDMAARDDPAQRAQIGNDRQQAAAELARVTDEIERTTKQIADLEEEARKAGVPPGWLR